MIIYFTLLMLASIQVSLINPKRSITTRAYVYKITSPSGKSYIGQTIQEPKDRWKQHITHSTTCANQCRALEDAMRRYGAENFSYEVLMSINENMVDYYEILFIKLYDSKVPNGYNLRDGGDGGCTETMREQMKIGNNKKIENKSWNYDHHPKVKYIYWYHEVNSYGTSLEGYRVSDHPNGRRKTIADSSLTIDEKYEQAVKYKIFLDSYDGYFDEREKRPMHMGRHKTTGYKVRFPNYKSKWFYTGDEIIDKKSAYDYLVSICPNDAFDKVFKDCVIPI